MKKTNTLLAGLMMSLAMTAVACDDDDDDESSDTDTTSTSYVDLEYSSDNASSWGNYMVQVAYLLKEDASTLYSAWNTSYKSGSSYAETFKDHNNDTFKSAKECVEQIIDGCIDIANEVGTAKIGDPYDLYMQGKTTEALYAVESWFSWHSRDDYRNNIYSIRNAYYGSTDGTVSDLSLSKVIEAADSELNADVIAKIDAAAVAIYAIPQPFRNNINSQEALDAQEACADLTESLETLKSYVNNTESVNSDEVLNDVVTNYVDVVVLPTYKELAELNSDLYDAAVSFKNSPSTANFKVCANAWLEARQPWETSEAFLFGPVADLGLDPNMDSWPLDAEQIVKILESGDYDELDWSGEYDEDSEDIAAAQAVRGYHTIEFLVFKDGEPRTVE